MMRERESSLGDIIKSLVPSYIEEQIQIANPFAIAMYETTFEEYDRFAQATGRRLPGDEGWGRGARPVINVSWNDAKAYAEWLSQQTGKRYRLPTEAEWEYAARDGGLDQKWAGTSDQTQLKQYAVYGTKHPEPVRSRKPNEIGLYDMSGNVAEWVEDCFGYNKAWLATHDCDRRKVRGGSYIGNIGPYSPLESFSEHFWQESDSRNNHTGFRLAQDIP